MAIARKDHVFAHFRGFEQFGLLGLGFMNVEGRHECAQRG